MKTVAGVITVATTVALLCAPALAQDVTFTITDTPQVGPQPSETWWAYERAIYLQNTNAAVAAQLEARGFRRDDTHPDMYVTTHRTLRTDIWGYGWSGWGDKHWARYGYGSHYLDSDINSTLVIDVTSANTGELLWRGVSMREMDFTSSPEHRLKRINKEVRRAFTDYPFGVEATTGRSRISSR